MFDFFGCSFSILSFEIFGSKIFVHSGKIFVIVSVWNELGSVRVSC